MLTTTPKRNPASKSNRSDAALGRLRAMCRPGESCCDISPRGFVKVDLRPSVKAFAFPGRLTAGV